MPRSIATSSVTNTSDSSLEFELAYQQLDEEEVVDEETLTVFQRCWRHINVPPQVQIVLSMLIPIIALVVFSLLTFVAAQQRQTYISTHRTLLNFMFDCSVNLLDERQRSSELYFRRNEMVPDAAAIALAMGKVQAARVIVDASCSYAADVAFESPDPQLRLVYSEGVRVILRQTRVARYRYDVDRISMKEFRSLFTDFAMNANSGLALLSESSKLKVESLWLLQLRQFRLLDNYFGLMAETARNYLRQLARGANETTALLEATNAYNDMTRYLKGSSDISTDQSQVAFAGWLGDNSTVTVLNELPRVLAGVSNYTEAQLEAIADAAWGKLRTVIPLLLRQLTEHKSLNGEVQLEGIKLAVAVVASALAAAYIIRAQIRSNHQITEEVQESRCLHRAVTKFVPKSFLRLMGCTSVTHIVAGDQTEVSVAMLFAEIHGFNAMTRSMSSSQLFEWLEVYFEQMSTITDKGHGFVDKFIGDAMFCVFMNPTEAVQSAIAMQAMTDQLNSEIVCGGGTQLIVIGIGIHQAVVSAGILGDSRRHTCTLVSSDVNLASRLEGLTKYYGARIVVSESTVDLCDRRALAFRRLGLIKCKGRENGVAICDVFQTDPLELKLFKRESQMEFERAVDLQAGGQLEAAKAVFASLREKGLMAKVRDEALDLKLAQDGAVDEMRTK